MTRPTFEQACNAYVHRYTMEHVPRWARTPRADGRYYAPHYNSDHEWYAHTLFYGETELAGRRHCYSEAQTWPFGVSMDAQTFAALLGRQR